MSQAWVLLWLPLTAPTPAERAHLEGWAEHARVSLRAAQPSPLPTAQPYPSAIVTHIEGELDAARLALDAGDSKGAIEHLVAAAELLTGHPELPQAAWLMAEADRLDAAVARALGEKGESEPAEAQARETEMRSAANVLEGERAATLDSAAAPLTGVTPIDTTRQLTLRGPEPGDTVEWDGKALEPHGGVWTVANTGGLHHVRVLRGSRLLFAGWRGAASEAASIELRLPSPAVCSTEDLALARSPETMSRVRCASWLEARPAAAGAIEVAECHPSGCKPFTRWPLSAPAAALGTKREPVEQPSSAHAYWGYGFLGVAVAATATALIYGATRSDDSDRTVWVYDGIR